MSSGDPSDKLSSWDRSAKEQRSYLFHCAVAACKERDWPTLTLSTLYKAEQRSLSTTTPSVIVSYHLCSTLTLTYNQLQKNLRHCTVFWLYPPTLIKVASNTRPCSKLGGTTLNGGRREVSIISHGPVTSSDLKHERLFFRQSTSTFLQPVVPLTAIKAQPIWCRHVLQNLQGTS